MIRLINKWRARRIREKIDRLCNDVKSLEIEIHLAETALEKQPFKKRVSKINLTFMIIGRLNNDLRSKQAEIEKLISSINKKDLEIIKKRATND